MTRMVTMVAISRLARLRVLFALVAPALLVRAAGGQSPTVITVDGRPSCAECAVRLSRVALLQSPDAASDIGPDARYARDSRGRFFVISRDREHVLVFDSAGRFQREFGRPGRGPGELSNSVGIAAGTGDSIYVLSALRQVSVFGPDLQFARSFAVQRGIYELRDGGPGRLLGLENSTPAASTGATVHVIDGAGAILRSIALEPRRRVNLSSGRQAGGFWALDWHRYELGLWNQQGRPLRIIHVSPSPWFREWSGMIGWMSGKYARPSTVEAVVEDPSGRLVVLGARAAPGWKPMTPHPSSGIQVNQLGGMFGPRAALAEYAFRVRERATESVIEILDLASRRVFASTRHLGAFTLLGARTVGRVVVTPDDTFAVEVLRLELVRP